MVGALPLLQVRNGAVAALLASWKSSGEPEAWWLVWQMRAPVACCQERSTTAEGCEAERALRSRQLSVLILTPVPPAEMNAIYNPLAAAAVVLEREH